MLCYAAMLQEAVEVHIVDVGERMRKASNYCFLQLQPFFVSVAIESKYVAI